MQITTRRHGSWYTARTDTPEERERALATVGAWAWFPYSDAVLVRADQLDKLDPPVIPPDPPPLLQTMVPNNGPAAGGTEAVIVASGGQSLLDATGVTYGDTPAAAWSVSNALQIRATSPPGSPGPVIVVVHTPRGDSNAVQWNYN
jgi:hypothetical protein